MRTYKIRLYPNKNLQEQLEKGFQFCGWLRNQLLEKSLENHQKTDKYLTEFQLNRLIGNYTNTTILPVSVLQNVSQRLSNGFSRYYKKIGNLPKYKNRNLVKSITFNKYGHGNRIIDNRHIRLCKLGVIKAKITTPILGEIKTLTLKKMPSCKYYLFITVDDSKILNKLPVRFDIYAGIDLGINKLVTLHTGEYFKNLKFNKIFSKKLTVEQRKLSRKKKNTKNYIKQRIKVAKVYEKIRNSRRDYFYKISNYLTTKYSTIVCEKLDVCNMFRKKSQKNQRRILYDIALREFINIFSWMCKKNSTDLIKIDPQNTSQICSNCGDYVKKDLSDRIHKCFNCGLTIDRDINAAWNILNRGLSNIFPIGTIGEVDTPMLVEINNIH